MKLLVIGISVIITLSTLATAGGLVYVFLKDPERRWAK